MLPVVHHPDYIAPLRPGHRFPMSKYGYLRQALARRGLLAGGLSPGPASAAQIALAHSPGYVERVFAGALAPDEVRRIGLPQSEAVLRMLFRHVEKPDFVVRWKWTPGDVAFWDNRAVQHYAVPDYETERSMQRIMLQGVRPGDTTPVPAAKPVAAPA